MRRSPTQTSVSSKVSNCTSEISLSRNATQRHGPATEKLLSPRRIRAFTFCSQGMSRLSWHGWLVIHTLTVFPPADYSRPSTNCTLCRTITECSAETPSTSPLLAQDVFVGHISDPAKQQSAYNTVVCWCAIKKANLSPPRLQTPSALLHSRQRRHCSEQTLDLATGVSRSRVREFGTVYPPHYGSVTLNLDTLNDF